MTAKGAHRGPRQPQWNISARDGDKDLILTWARRCSSLGLAPSSRGVMPAIRVAVQLMGELTDDQIMGNEPIGEGTK